MNTQRQAGFGRREFFRWVGRHGVGLGLAGASVPTLLVACSRRLTPAPPGAPRIEDAGAAAIVGDVIDFSLMPDGWPGAFGFVTFRLHKGFVDGRDVYFIRTDTSDQPFAEQQRLVWAPSLSALIPAGLTGSAYLVTGGSAEQSTILSTEPGRGDYTPAWRIHRVTWRRTPRTLSSVAEVLSAERRGDVSVERTDIVLNAAVVRWSSGEMPVDTELSDYLGAGQLVEAPDTRAMRVTFKLHECFPGSRYIVTDTSMGPMAEGMHVVHSPRLAGGSEAGATGSVNVFMNGIEGPGPMGFQPSVFDSQAGNPAWSPYWDHWTYAWNGGYAPRVLKALGEVKAAVDAGQVANFAGTPDTKGAIFVVNCQVPVVAANTFEG